MQCAASVIFENQPKLLSLDKAAELLAMPKRTVEDMRCRPWNYGVQEGMFFKNGRRVFVRTDMLKNWFISRISGR